MSVVGNALEEYLLLLQFGPAVLKSVAVLAVELPPRGAPAGGMEIVWCSGLLEDLFGYGRGELRGKPLDALLRPEDRGPHREHFARYLLSPNTRTMNAGVWVDGLKKDGTVIKV